MKATLQIIELEKTVMLLNVKWKRCLCLGGAELLGKYRLRKPVLQIEAISKPTKGYILTLLWSTMRNKESNEWFIWLRWRTINRLFDSVFHEIFAKKDSIRKVIGKKSQKFLFRKNFDFPEM